MRFFVGTSGYSYKEWKGGFYPEKLPQKDMLGYYAQRFGAVEANSSFYRMPSADVLEEWARQTPPSFRFALKAPQTITHHKRLKDAQEATEQFIRAASALKDKQGPLLFGLPPNFKKDLSRLKDFLRPFDRKTPSAFEFRHESWLDEEVFDCLRKASCALCIADTDETPASEIVSTARWGYLRLRREKYTDRQLREWIKRIESQEWKDVYVFFKHEDTGTGPKFAARFLELAGE